VGDDKIISLNFAISSLLSLLTFGDDDDDDDDDDGGRFEIIKPNYIHPVLHVIIIISMMLLQQSLRQTYTHLRQLSTTSVDDVNGIV